MSENYTHHSLEDIGQRAWFLEQARDLEIALDFSTSKFVTLSNKFFQKYAVDQKLAGFQETIDFVDASSVGFRSAHPAITEQFVEAIEPALDELKQLTDLFDGDRIIVRPSPLDDQSRKDLSFAGTYKGYMPLGPGTREDDLIKGTAEMLAGRFTKHGNAYYERHAIPGERRLGGIFMEPFFELGVAVPLFYGTAYIVDGHIRNEYHILPPPDQPQRDPRLMVRKSGQLIMEDDDLRIEEETDFPERMAKLLDGLEARFSIPLDVEYIVDPKGDMYVVQIRPLSGRHYSNWKLVKDVSESGISHRSAIINSVGVARGEVLDLRHTNGADELEQAAGKIVVINHEPSVDGFDSETFFKVARHKKIKDVQLVVDHGQSRKRDHLQFALVEDPGVDFIVQTTNRNFMDRLEDGAEVVIKSNGINAEIEDSKLSVTSDLNLNSKGL